MGKRITLENLLREDIFAGKDKEKAVRELFVRLPREQEDYWGWKDLKTADMEVLELSMRRWDEALEILSVIDDAALEYHLASMQFQLLNVILFYNHEMIFEARSYAEKAAKNATSALECFIDINGKIMMSAEDETYAVRESWNCILTFCALFELEAKLGELDKARISVKTASEYLKILKPYLIKDFGLCDAAGRRFWSMSAILADCGDIDAAGKLLEEAGGIYYELFEKYEKAYAKAMYLHIEIVKLTAQFLAGTADVVHLEKLREDGWNLRHLPDVTEFENKIADELDIMIMICMGLIELAERKLTDASEIFETEEMHIRECVTYFEQLSINENPWLAYLGEDFAKRLRGFRIFCGMQSAQCDYFEGKLTDAKKKFENVLESMESYPNTMPEARLRTTSAIYGMMGDICGRNGDSSQAEFYFDRNVIILEKQANLTNLVKDWGNYAHSCLFVAEFLKSIKKNETAKPYAQKGLLACEKIRSLDSEHEALVLEKKFEKILAKKKGIFARWF